MKSTAGPGTLPLKGDRNFAPVRGTNMNQNVFCNETLQRVPQQKNRALLRLTVSQFGGLTKNGIFPRCQSLRTILETVRMFGSPPWVGSKTTKLNQALLKLYQKKKKL